VPTPPFKFAACPFCGNNDKIRVADNAEPSSKTFWVTCDYEGCECDGPWRKSAEDAVSAWNYRGGIAVS
jgi:hypothetical protein